MVSADVLFGNYSLLDELLVSAVHIWLTKRIKLQRNSCFGKKKTLQKEEERANIQTDHRASPQAET